MGEFMSSNDITRKTGMSASNQTFSVKFGSKSGGGGGGTDDYEQLDNKPKIEGVTLTGNKTASELGLALSSDIPDVSDFITEADMQTALEEKADRTDIPTVPTDVSAFNNDAGYQTSSDVATAISGKADKSEIPTVPTNVSAFNNDSGYQTSGDVASAISGKADRSELPDMDNYYDKSEIDAMLLMDISDTVFGGE